MDDIHYIREILESVNNKIDALFKKNDTNSEQIIRHDERIKLLNKFVWGGLFSSIGAIIIVLISIAVQYFTGIK